MLKALFIQMLLATVHLYLVQHIKCYLTLLIVLGQIFSNDPMLNMSKDTYKT